MDDRGTELDRVTLSGTARCATRGGDDTCWLVTHAPDTLWRVPAQGAPASTSAPIALSEAPSSLIWASDRRLWWVEASASRALGWNPEASRSLVTWAIPGGTRPAIAASTDSVWVTSRDASNAWRLDATTGELQQAVALAAMAEGLVAVDINGFAWVSVRASDGGSSVLKLDGVKVLRQITPVRSPLNALVADQQGYVWMMARDASALMRLTPANQEQRLLSDASMARPQAVGVTPMGEAWVASPGLLARFLLTL
jgi:streptogramin lyase